MWKYLLVFAVVSGPVVKLKTASADVIVPKPKPQPRPRPQPPLPKEPDPMPDEDDNRGNELLPGLLLSASAGLLGVWLARRLRASEAVHRPGGAQAVSQG